MHCLGKSVGMQWNLINVATQGIKLTGLINEIVQYTLVIFRIH